MRIRYRKAVRQDVAAIRQYGVETWGIGRTMDFLAGFEEAIARLIETPRMGRQRDAIAPGLRSIRHRGYQVFYGLEQETVVVVAILNERSNMAALDLADRLEGS